MNTSTSSRAVCWRSSVAPMPSTSWSMDGRLAGPPGAHDRPGSALTPTVTRPSASVIGSQRNSTGPT